MQNGQTPDSELLDRIRGEYSEMPGLSLTLAQAQRLWVLDGRRTCEALLDTLVAEDFLRRTLRGAYVRPTTTSV
jgi:hypothetical protein